MRIKRNNKNKTTTANRINNNNNAKIYVMTINEVSFASEVAFAANVNVNDKRSMNNTADVDDDEIG